ncbi:class I SAM-dependent methyltransferase [Kribbella capetownensis]|uniref:Class I SAM-dependent methyltransferase n=1 Tax=Kribbella capetownensis TaxID=1572659 RepID=A0A4R0JSA3_9ACTN|nr:class I SAM-dependent methyltransferase [Kribbella capetownensis]TCC44975.1 class I SAM-dependent methyltransferase [Kribbella capetownensis]
MDQPFDYDAELRRYHERLQTAADVRPDDHVLDIGCGTGLTTRDVAKRAASAVGVDISAQRVATARRLAEQEGLRNVSFEQADVQDHGFPADRFSLGVSRFGTMFFTDPEVAFTNIARALRPGSRLVQLVWQAGEHQEWYAVFGGDQRTEPATGGAFSLADPATAERILTTAGFTDVDITDVREPVYYGKDAETAYEAARSLRMTQDLVAGLDPAQAEQARQRVLTDLAAHQTPDGVWFDSRAWIITAHLCS